MPLVATEMGEQMMKRFSVIKRRIQETKVLPPRVTGSFASHSGTVFACEQSTHILNLASTSAAESGTTLRPPRIILEAGEAPVKWLSAKDKIAGMR